MIHDIRIVEEYGLILNSSIIIFGAGGKGKRLFAFAESLGCNIIGFCDNDEKKAGQKIESVPIFSKIELLEKMEKDTIIIVASVWFQDIIQELIKMIPSNIIFTDFSFRLSVFMHYKKIRCKNSAWLDFYMKNLFSRELQIFLDDNEKMALKAYLSMLQNKTLVYQPGKVGSTTLVESIQAKGYDACHCHILRSIEVFGGGKLHLESLKYALSQFRGKIIIPIREPISRDISQFFQLMQARLPVLLLKHKMESLHDTFYDIFCSDSHQALQEPYYIYQDYLNAKGRNKGAIFEWFDLELRENFGVDVYQYPFDKEKGYSIISYHNVEFMVIQMEKMNQLEEELASFLEIPHFKMVPSNTSQQKEYYFLYQNFKDKLCLPKNYFNKYYKDNKHYQHFYGKANLKQSEEKWNHFM